MGLVIFDFDNTLVHSKIDFAGIRRDLIALLRANGATDETDDGLMRLSIGQIIALGEAHDGREGRTDWRTPQAGGGTPPLLGPEAWRIVLEYERAGMLEATIEDQAAESLHALRADGFHLAVFTNNARPATLAALDKFGLRGAFDLILTRDEVPMKPDPVGIETARAHFDGRVERAVMIGDSWLDGTAAQLAGIPFIAFRPRPGVMAERRIPLWRAIERLDELPPILADPWPESTQPPALETDEQVI